MLRLDMDTRPGGVAVHWRTGRGLSFHRQDGSLILTITAAYADDRALATAAHALNFMLRGPHGSNTSTARPSGADSGDNLGDGG
jgi:hypothetical protein